MRVDHGEHGELRHIRPRVRTEGNHDERGPSQRQPSHTAAGVFGWPGGRWLVGIAGVILIIVCAVQAYEALNEKFLSDNKTERMGRREREVFSVIGRIGLVSRALVAAGIIAFAFFSFAEARYRRL